MTSPSKPYMPTTPRHREKASNNEGLGGNGGSGLDGFEETPFSIKKRMNTGGRATNANGGAAANAPPISPTKSRVSSSVVKSPSKLRMMSKTFTPENMPPPKAQSSDPDDADDLLEYSPQASPNKKIPRTPSKPRVLRSKEELDQSARKRAYNVIRKSQIDDHEEVDETELRLAEKIIQDSYDDDMDSDYTPEPSTPRRGRRAGGATKRAHEEDEDEEAESDFSDTPDTPSTRRRKGKAPAAAKNKTVRRTAARPTSGGDGDGDSDEDFKGTDVMAALFLDGYEGYFDQHKTRDKISTVPFSRAPTVEFKEFIQNVDLSRTFYRDSRDFLLSLYRTMFTQWHFELSQGFGLLFYGVGSKRNLLLEFVTSTIPEDIPVLVVNGYNPATSFKELLNSLIPILIEDTSLKLPKNTPDLLQVTLDYLENKRESPTTGLYKPKVVLLVHNIDGESMRSDKTQAFLSKLSSAKEIWVVATIDHINAPVMWDAAKLALYNFLWHDLTTYESYAIETSFEDPLALGKVRTAAGNKGVKYVLSSLTMKARGLYRVLICHQIETMATELHGSIDDQRNVAGTAQFGIEFKLLYQKCVEEFLVSNELNFRTMLTEFIDHKMAIITKDQSGTELVYVPYTKETMERILEEDLMD